MRTYKHFPNRVVPLLMLALVGLLGSSCNSYRGVAENDGIYRSETRVVEVQTEEDKNNYYKQYFSTKAAQLEELPEEDVIFTDVEAYYTTESLDDEGYVVVEETYEDEAYGGWGTNDGEVTVNVYNTGWYGAGWYGGWYGPGWYSPWNHWGWGGYWWRNSWGWNGFYGSPYWGWGFGFYSPWNWYNPYYYYQPYYNNHYGYASLNRGRSNLDYINGRSSYDRGRSNVNATRDSYRRSEAARRGNYNTSRVSRYNTSRTRTNRVYQPNTTRTSRYNTSRTRTNRVYRPNTNTRSQRNNSTNRNTIRQNTSRSNSRPSYSRPPSSRPSSGSINRGGSSRGGSSRSSGRGGRG